MAILTKDEIHQAPDVRTQIVAVPEWGGEVKIQTITVGRRRKVREAIAASGATPEDDGEPFLFIACVIEPEFTTEDLPMLREKSAEAFKRVMDAIYTLMNETREATAAAVAGFPERSAATAGVSGSGQAGSHGA